MRTEGMAPGGKPRKVTHLGGENGVTGSCHLLQANGLNILVDCGAAQGNDAVPAMADWPVKAADIRFVFVTHAHVDHSGRIPELVKNGFHGEIITTDPTKALLVPMLRDAMSFSRMGEVEAGRLVQTIDDLSWGFEYDRWFDLKNGVRFKLRRAGHILGACFVRFEVEDPAWSVTFSGDLGASDTPLLPEADAPEPCDLLILESTYGDRLHEDRSQRVQRLGSVLARSLADKGKVFIPAFALGRTQELLYEMDRLFSNAQPRKTIPGLAGATKIPVLLDSPLGLEVTKIYSSLSEYWDKEARELLRSGDDPIDFGQLYAVCRHEDHRRVLDMPGPAVILAGSGMCTGGRIVDHLKDGLGDPRNDVFFVGYQAAGTPGRAMVDYGRKPGGYVILDGERCEIKAKIHVLTGYSAHADQKGLTDWVQSMPGKPGRIKLVHGEPPAQRVLAERLRGLGYDI